MYILQNFLAILSAISFILSIYYEDKCRIEENKLGKRNPKTEKLVLRYFTIFSLSFVIFMIILVEVNRSVT